MPYIFDPARYAGFPAHQTRAQVSAEIERMIDFLDGLDPDPDLEPYLAGVSGDGTDREGDECETHESDGGCDDEDNADDEPSLGWCQPSGGWHDIYGAYGRHAGNDGISHLPREPRSLIDCEGDEHDGREPDVDAESIFWTEAVNQDSDKRRVGSGCYGEDMEPDLGFCIPGAGWTGGSGDDREGDDEREENGDEHDYSGHEGEGATGIWYAGGVRIGKGMVRAARAIRRKQMVTA